MAKLTERLAEPKNYKRMNYLDINLKRLRSQSIDFAGAQSCTDSIFVDQGGVDSVRQSTNFPLPHLGQSKMQESDTVTQQEQITAATDASQSNFHRLMSLDFGNNNTRRRQFMNRTTMVGDGTGSRFGVARK